MIMVLNQKKGVFTVYGCNPKDAAHPEKMIESAALWGSTTKPGIYKDLFLAKPADAQNYPLGVGLVFNKNTDKDQAIHGVYLPEQAERMKSLETPTISDNEKSKGCINIPNFGDVLDYNNKLISTGYLKKYPPLAIIGPK